METQHDSKFTVRLVIALILSIIVVLIALYAAYSFISQRDILIFALVIAALHLATIVSVVQRKKIGRVLGIISWIPLCTGLIGLWGFFYYAFDKNVRTILIK